MSALFFRICDKVRIKLAESTTGTSLKIESQKKNTIRVHETTKVLTNLRVCTGFCAFVVRVCHNTK